MTINKKCNVNYLKKQLTIIKGTEKIEIEFKIDEIGKKWQKIIEETKTDFEIDLILNLIDIQKEKLVSEVFEKEISKKDRELLLSKIYEIRKNLESLKK
ncbi:hypothetical protein [Methanococcus maripaludis]|jgi:hypothetical protein|uniref:Uncharacterized protein n=3 Tax=Methanococcus maripaludis TaxID=39152 RepID=A0A2Z5PIQ8_METMI|nr:hypothetical protein [Methanococcus maripaludis]AEK20596.1 hypothetical protein GYY_08715 [Methanococcus maripaludis X1]BAP61919.1 hypothetical protein MMKA1_18020 [Methanococcus maripaludis KA1]BAP63770.1 hypothetical protein MMOS7_16840 [Methanococcus maripaludis OS7]